MSLEATIATLLINCSLADVSAAIACEGEQAGQAITQAFNVDNWQQIANQQFEADCYCTEGDLDLTNLDPEAKYMLVIRGQSTHSRYLIDNNYIQDGSLFTLWNNNGLKDNCKVEAITLYKATSEGILGGNGQGSTGSGGSDYLSSGGGGEGWAALGLLGLPFLFLLGGSDSSSNDTTTRPELLEEIAQVPDPENPIQDTPNQPDDPSNPNDPPDPTNPENPIEPVPEPITLLGTGLALTYGTLIKRRK